MAVYNPKEKELNVVLLGSFNPRIFHPQWFADHDFISNSDLNLIIENNDVLTHKQVAQFSSSWFQLEVTEGRLSLSTTQEAYFEMLLDLLSGTFSTLHHTPISMVGLNLTVKQSFHKPNDSKLFEKKYLEFSEFKKIDENIESSQIKLSLINPIYKVGQKCNFELTKINFGNYSLHINQHFDLKSNASGKDFVEMLSEYGRSSINASEKLFKKVLEA